MGLRLLWQDIGLEHVPYAPEFPILWEAAQATFKKLARPETEIRFSFVEKNAVLVYHPYLELLNDSMLVDEIIRAERDGYDAAVIGCFADPALQAARGVVDMPVTGLCESSLLVAQLLGQKIGIVTVGPGWVPLMEANVRRYGFGDRTVRMRQFDIAYKMSAVFDAVRGRPDDLIALFEAEALKCVADGADVVIAGCCYVGIAFSRVGYREVARTGVPVVDPTVAAFRLAEMMADLRRVTGLSKSTCPTSPYVTPPREILDRVRQDFGF